ncbi:MAG: Ig-like domain-containing protein, partial [Akkermansia sp.]|nr:Ig-like domain-containing protein [Akkermansia sp.]
MKPLFITACILASLAYTVPVYAQSAQPTTAPSETQELKPSIDIEGYYGYIRKDATLNIHFDTPMIAEDAIHTAPTAEHIKLYYTEGTTPVEYKAQWVSASELQVRITGETEPFKYITAEVPAGLKDLAGNEHAGAT